MRYFAPLTVLGFIVAGWAGGFVFHLWPLDTQAWAWWQLPWAYTVAFGCLGIVYGFAKLGVWMEDRYGD